VVSGAATLRGVDRRTLIQRAILLVGGAVAGAPRAVGQGRGLPSARRKLLAAYADILIPETGTPGAFGAGVPAAVDALMRNWASEATATLLGATLDALDAAAHGIAGAGLLSLPAAKRIDVIRAFDAQQIAGRDPGYLRLKDLVLVTYYLSEPGATQELRYEPVPGAWEASVPLGLDRRAWAV
jgi:gluconate 2-dehydrogenase gamma chain